MKRGLGGDVIRGETSSMGQSLHLLTPLWAAVFEFDHVGVGKLRERHTRWELSLTGGPAGRWDIYEVVTGL